MKLPLFATIVVTFAFIWFTMKRSTKKMRETDEKFWEKEREANSVRKKPLTDLEYITVPFDELPINDFAELPAVSKNIVISECIDRITSLKDKKIVNLNGISNTDLKLRYGVSNLTVLSEYDENYTILVSSLADYAQELYRLSQKGDESNRPKLKEAAIKVLYCAIKCKSDVKRSYTLLADIYEEAKEYDRIEELIETASELNSAAGEGIVKELKKRSIYTPSYIK